MSRDISLRILRSTAEIESVRNLWTAWQCHPNSDLDFFLAVIQTRPNVLRPHVVLASRGGVPEALLVARFETNTVRINIGYKTLCRLPVRSMTVIYSGLLGKASAEVTAALCRTMEESAAEAGADLVDFSPLKTDSVLAQAARQNGSLLSRDFFPRFNEHWAVHLPGSYEAFFKGLSTNTRHNLRRYSKRFLDAFGKDMTIRKFRQRSELDEFVADAETIAKKTYHRGLGVGFTDKAETRQLLGLGCDQQWFRGWVLYLQNVPCAFWDGLLYGRTFFTSTTGYDPAYHEYRLGNFLLQKVIEDLIQNEAAAAVDFGFGDAQYKQDLCDVHWQETALYRFMPTLKGVSANLMRTPVMVLDRGGRKILTRTRLLQRFKSFWRKRLAANGSPARSRN
jgi:CelD/BcsL family acetyltransferase involved in cellulose biosynthesis